MVPHGAPLSLLSTNILQPPVTPHAGLWTLRFKQSKTTVLLFVDKGQSLSSIKSDLLQALMLSGHQSFNGRALPSSADDIEFALPVDKNDLKQGWTSLDSRFSTERVDKGRRSKGDVANGTLDDSPLGLGLKDGGVLAFRFRASDESGPEETMDTNKALWHVAIPSYEDESATQSQR